MEDNLISAVNFGSVEMVSLFLKYTDITSETLFFKAAWLPRIEVVKFLLENTDILRLAKLKALNKAKREITTLELDSQKISNNSQNAVQEDDSRLKIHLESGSQSRLKKCKILVALMQENLDKNMNNLVGQTEPKLTMQKDHDNLALINDPLMPAPVFTPLQAHRSNPDNDQQPENPEGSKCCRKLFSYCSLI